MNLRDDPAAKRGAALMRPIPDYGRDAPCLRDPVRPRLVWAQRSALVCEAERSGLAGGISDFGRDLLCRVLSLAGALRIA